MADETNETAVRKPNQKDKIVRATAELLRQRGYAATGLSDIVERSRAPKGSLYHYFPGGKDEIARAAVGYAGDLVAHTLDGLALSSDSAAAAFAAYGELLAGWMTESGFRDGCPIATTLLETAADNAEIAEVGRAAFARWSDIFERRLIADGAEPSRANKLARYAIMVLEGALLMARVERSAAPILLAVQETADLFERETER